MAALRAGIHEVLLPQDNVTDLAEMDPQVRGAVNFTAVSHMDQVLEKALLPASVPEQRETRIPEAPLGVPSGRDVPGVPIRQ